jgi:putative transposase
LRFDFIRRHKKAYPVALLCKVLEVSRSGFYDYLRDRHRPDQDAEQAALESKIRSIFDKSKKTYGSRRILSQLRLEGRLIGRYRVRSLMCKLGLKAKTPRRYKVTTDSDHEHPAAPNLLNRKFDVDVPNKVWTTDISVPQKAA